MHSRFTSQALKSIGCSVVCSCHCAVSRSTSQTSLRSCVLTVKCYVGNFFLSTLPAYSSTDLPCDCLSGPISAWVRTVRANWAWQTNNKLPIEGFTAWIHCVEMNFSGKKKIVMSVWKEKRPLKGNVWNDCSQEHVFSLLSYLSPCTGGGTEPSCSLVPFQFGQRNPHVHL